MKKKRYLDKGLISSHVYNFKGENEIVLGLI